MTDKRTFAEIVAERNPRLSAAPASTPPTPGAPAAVDATVIDPSSGEVLILKDAATNVLAELVLGCQEREANLKVWRQGAEDELRARLEKEGRRTAVVGDLELAVGVRAHARVWDADMLRDVVSDLVAEGVVGAPDVTELVRREVNGKVAQTLLGRLQGEPLERVTECFHWEDRGRPKLTITRVPDLADALPEAS